VTQLISRSVLETAHCGEDSRKPSLSFPDEDSRERSALLCRHQNRWIPMNTVNMPSHSGRQRRSDRETSFPFRPRRAEKSLYFV
jgi:hypothetical protein